MSSDNIYKNNSKEFTKNIITYLTLKLKINQIQKFFCLYKNMNKNYVL